MGLQYVNRVINHRHRGLHSAHWWQRKGQVEVGEDEIEGLFYDTSKRNSKQNYQRQVQENEALRIEKGNIVFGLICWSPSDCVPSPCTHVRGSFWIRAGP